MKAGDRAILIGLMGLALLAVFWFAVLAPKREHASELQTQIDELRASVETQRQNVDAAERARLDYDAEYRRLVVLGKAVPRDDDTSSLFDQLSRISAKAHVDFREVALSDATEATPIAQPGAAAPAAPVAPAGAPASSTTSTSTTTASTPTPASATTPPAGALPTEAIAAALPIGAKVGSAGLPVVPYDIVFAGDFFDAADVMAGIDSLVSWRGSRLRVSGRLLTVDGFTMERNPAAGFPSLRTSISLTSYVVPDAQGLTAGATAGGPAPATATTVSAASPQAGSANPQPVAAP